MEYLYGHIFLLDTQSVEQYCFHQKPLLLSNFHCHQTEPGFPLMFLNLPIPQCEHISPLILLPA